MFSPLHPRNVPNQQNMANPNGSQDEGSWFTWSRTNYFYLDDSFDCPGHWTQTPTFEEYLKDVVQGVNVVKSVNWEPDFDFLIACESAIIDDSFQPIADVAEESFDWSGQVGTHHELEWVFVDAGIYG